MLPVNVSILIDAPREQVFDFLQDIANHAAFTDHFLVDWRLTREDPAGRGAGARFRVKAPARRFSWADVTFAEVQRPRRIVEVGRMGKGNRIRTLGEYELSEAAGGSTRVRYAFRTWPALPSDRIMEALGARWWVARQNGRALRRLRALLEGVRGESSGSRASAGERRVTVAGG